METFLAIVTIIMPFFWYFLGHTHGHRWTLKNPGKDHIEYFFDVEKLNSEPEDKRSVATEDQSGNKS